MSSSCIFFKAFSLPIGFSTLFNRITYLLHNVSSTSLVYCQVILVISNDCYFKKRSFALFSLVQKRLSWFLIFCFAFGRYLPLRQCAFKFVSNFPSTGITFPSNSINCFILAFPILHIAFTSF